MPEGHTIHRLARDLHADLAGHGLGAETRQDRFAAAVRHLDGRTLVDTTAMGKHLLLHLEETDDRGPETLHVHLGLVGAFTRHVLPAPEPSDALRVRLTGPRHAWDLTGPMLCGLRGPEVVDEIAAKLGPDPLRPDADPARFVDAVRSSRRAVGDLLLDQAVIAGLGNVYRAEILHLEGIHPAEEGRSLTETQVRSLWRTAVAQLRLGLRRNRIVTVPLAGRRMAAIPKHESFHVYKQEECRSCGAPVETTTVGGRSVFACNACQPRP